MTDCKSVPDTSQINKYRVDTKHIKQAYETIEEVFDDYLKMPDPPEGSHNQLNGTVRLNYLYEENYEESKNSFPKDIFAEMKKVKTADLFTKVNDKTKTEYRIYCQSVGDEDYQVPPFSSVCLLYETPEFQTYNSDCTNEEIVELFKKDMPHNKKLVDLLTMIGLYKKRETRLLDFVKNTENIEFATFYNCMEYCFKEYLFKGTRAKTIAECAEPDMVWVMPHDSELENLYVLLSGEGEREELVLAPGISYCGCKTGNMCANKRCSCVRNEVICSILCHQGAIGDCNKKN